MTATFNSILTGISGEDIQALYAKLPKYQEYIDAEQQESIRVLEKKIENAQSEKEEEELYQELEVKKEELTTSTNEKMTTSINQALLGMGEDLLEKGVDDKQLQKMLGVEKEELIHIKHSMPSEFQMQFYFATTLHGIFEKFPDIEKVDYCPVAIMYCKLVEAILKKYHTPIYAYELPEEAVKAYKDPSKAIRFGMSKSENAEEKQAFEDHKHDITMGSYVFPIWNKNKQAAKNPSINKLSDNADTKEHWREHARSAGKIVDCRNRSAHESVPIKKEELEALMSEMFKNGAFMRMLDLEKVWREEKHRLSEDV